MKFPTPALTPPVLHTWQFSYAGFTWGNATPAAVLKVTGLGDNPKIRSSTPTRARDHGQLVGLDLYAGRTFTIDVWAKPNAVSLQTNLLRLAAVLEVGLQTEQPLWFKQPNLPLLCVMCRPRHKTVPWDVNYGAAMVAKPVAQFHATDPRLYGPGQSVDIGLPVPSKGVKFPITFPVVFGSAKPGTLGIVNNGNTTMRPVVIFTGPVTNPAVDNASAPGVPSLAFSNPTQGSGYTVAAGDQLVVDLDAQSVQYYVGGVASGSPPAPRMSWVVTGSTWWSLLAGRNLIQFHSSDATATAATCTVHYADAYIL